ncbi:hypothetical protein [Vibrio hyugaensis]|uniref:hypothetical protein n=1 Tax=Vibrio hyugaensis TaxID=1534743 RepID=UPI003DA00F86
MMSTKDARLRIANTILAQLGGNRFIVMTGAKQFVAIEQGLMFTLPAALPIWVSTKYAWSWPPVTRTP